MSPPLMLDARGRRPPAPAGSTPMFIRISAVVTVCMQEEHPNDVMIGQAALQHVLKWL